MSRFHHNRFRRARFVAALVLLGGVLALPAPAAVSGDLDGAAAPPMIDGTQTYVPHLRTTGSLLIDRTHAETFNVSGFTDYLVSEGWTVEELTSGPVTLETLAAYDVFMVPVSLSGIAPFDPPEVAAVRDFVDLGKGLWVFHESQQSTTGPNSIASEFGVEFRADTVTDPTNNEDGNPSWPNIHLLNPHPITEGVTDFGYYTGCCVTAEEPAEVIATGDDDATSTYCVSFPPVLAAYSGTGRAVFYGDNTPLHPNYYPDGLDDAEILFLNNIIEWLRGAEPTPVRTATWGRIKSLRE